MVYFFDTIIIKAIPAIRKKAPNSNIIWVEISFIPMAAPINLIFELKIKKIPRIIEIAACIA